jgi:DNA-binding response OmpR family regulator
VHEPEEKITRQARPPTSLRAVSTPGEQSVMNNTLLLVEDDRNLADALKEFLASEGYSVLCAKNGREALEILRACRVLPRLIILDLMMPILDRWGFLLERRKEARLFGIPVVIMTGSNSITHKARAAGAKAVLHKPFMPQHLLPLIRQFSTVFPESS